MRNVPALVVRSPGTNRDEEMAFALEQAGADATRISMDELCATPSLLDSNRLLVLAGGFSYGDALGSGRIAALELEPLTEAIQSFVANGCPVLGVCNGFQTLVRAGLLPGAGTTVTLAPNERGVFDCRWIHLDAPTSRCVWTKGLSESMFVPIAHGEGRFLCDDATLKGLQDNGRIALRYCTDDGKSPGGHWPTNPNGAVDDIAGICDETGLILGLMPHPEDHVLTRQHPQRSRGETGGNALALFANGIRRAAET
jgi:phosphoribosylformylglycinamidine synthase I